MTVDLKPRLSTSTKNYAAISLGGYYGKNALQNKFISLDHIKNFNNVSQQEKYNIAIKEIALQAPLQIEEDQLLVGSASLGGAISHVVPATYKGEIIFNSVSHLTMGFDRIIKYGLNIYEEKIANKLSDNLTHSEKDVLKGMLAVIDAIKIWHQRYLDEISRLIKSTDTPDKYQNIYNNIINVPFNPPCNFRESVQALWFLFAFARLCGNWPGIGRIDEILGDYLKNDISNGSISMDTAREILAHFFIKGCEWITLENIYNGGDAQHYQNIVLGGINRAGNEITNEVTHLVLEILEELPISDFPVAVRINENTPYSVYELIAKNISHGGGVISVYNENLILKSITDFGYNAIEARDFANDGCWEIQIPGKTCFSYYPFDGYQILQENVLKLNQKDFPIYNSFEDIYNTYITELKKSLIKFNEIADNTFQDTYPTSVIDLFTEGCIENARGYYNRGPKYNVLSPHIGGMPDVANSLFTFKTIVFDEKKVNYSDFINILKDNWQNNPELLQYIKSNIIFYGNDFEPADQIMCKLFNDYTDIISKTKERNGILRPAGISTFGRQIEWKSTRYSHAHGFLQGDILASNASPTPGTDTEGVTAEIKSHCKLDLVKLPCGTALDIKLSPTAFTSNNSITGIIGLIKAFVSLGGFFMQIDMVDNETLLNAQKHPENHQTLSVRISGWSARFITLTPDWQKMIIERTDHKKT